MQPSKARTPTDEDLVGALRTVAEWFSRDLPPGVPSPRSFRARARRIPEARLVGRDVIVPVGAWERSLERPERGARSHLLPDLPAPRRRCSA